MRYLKSSFALLSVLAISACTIDNPMPMGRGYSSYNETYKSAEGPKADKIGYAYNAAKNDAVMQNIDAIALDLVQNLNIDATTIYFEKPRVTGFYGALDHRLRQNMMAAGYTLATTPADAKTIKIVATPPRCATSHKPKTGTAYVGLHDEDDTALYGQYYHDVATYDLVRTQQKPYAVPTCNTCCEPL